MDFARKQLEKYGWTDGKGLGKHENGISQAIKPKLKRSVTGVGHDPAAEFNEHWWSALYDKAAKNVEVKEKNGKTKKIKTIDPDDFLITNSTWKINNNSKSKGNEEYKDYFVKTAVLSGGSRTENIKSDSESEAEDRKDVFQMTDEELFKACEGRTAHKGARHGLKATGKLARIQQQEQMLLALPKYEGYSHSKKLKQNQENVVEELTLHTVEIKERKKKKKKKRCVSSDAVQPCQWMPDEKLKSKSVDVDNDATEKNTEINTEIVENVEVKKSKKRNIETTEVMCDETEVSKKKKKKKKVKDHCME